MAKSAKKRAVKKKPLGNFTREDLYAFRRKSFQLTTGIAVMILLYTYILTVKMLMVVFALGVVFSFILKKFEVPVFSKLLKWFGTPAEDEIVPGKEALLLLLGFALPILLFPRDVALGAIAVLTVGDSLAHIVGRFRGKVPAPMTENKMVEGSIVGTFCAFIASMLFVNPVQAFFASMFAMMLLTLEVQIWRKTSYSDSVIIPVAAGVVMMVIQFI